MNNIASFFSPAAAPAALREFSAPRRTGQPDVHLAVQAVQQAAEAGPSARRTGSGGLPAQRAQQAVQAAPPAVRAQPGPGGGPASRATHANPFAQFGMRQDADPAHPAVPGPGSRPEAACRGEDVDGGGGRGGGAGAAAGGYGRGLQRDKAQAQVGGSHSPPAAKPSSGGRSFLAKLLQDAREPEAEEVLTAARASPGSCEEAGGAERDWHPYHDQLAQPHPHQERGVRVPVSHPPGPSTHRGSFLDGICSASGDMDADTVLYPSAPPGAPTAPPAVPPAAPPSVPPSQPFRFQYHLDDANMREAAADQHALGQSRRDDSDTLEDDSDTLGVERGSGAEGDGGREGSRREADVDTDADDDERGSRGSGGSDDGREGARAVRGAGHGQAAQDLAVQGLVVQAQGDIGSLAHVAGFSRTARRVVDAVHSRTLQVGPEAMFTYQPHECASA